MPNFVLEYEDNSLIEEDELVINAAVVTSEIVAMPESSNGFLQHNRLPNELIPEETYTLEVTMENEMNTSDIHNDFINEDLEDCQSMVHQSSISWNSDYNVETSYDMVAMPESSNGFLQHNRLPNELIPEETYTLEVTMENEMITSDIHNDFINEDLEDCQSMVHQSSISWNFDYNVETSYDMIAMPESSNGFLQHNNLPNELIPEETYTLEVTMENEMNTSDIHNDFINEDLEDCQSMVHQSSISWNSDDIVETSYDMVAIPESSNGFLQHNSLSNELIPEETYTLEVIMENEMNNTDNNLINEDLEDYQLLVHQLSVYNNSDYIVETGNGMIALSESGNDFTQITPLSNQLIYEVGSEIHPAADEVSVTIIGFQETTNEEFDIPVNGQLLEYPQLLHHFY